MIEILINAFKIIFLLSFVIFIHECGHFFVARWFKVKVKEFAIGFGPIIWQKQGKETKYSLRLIPLGGFVNMLGEAERSDEEGSYTSISVWKRILILLGGATVNIIFGLVVYFVLVSYIGNNISTRIESIPEGFAAEASDLESGDQILRIDGRRTRTSFDVNRILGASEGRELRLTTRRGDTVQDIYLVPTKMETRLIGIVFGMIDDEDLSTQIRQVSEGGPAYEAGIVPNDRIISVNGVEVNEDVAKTVDLISDSPARRNSNSYRQSWRIFRI